MARESRLNALPPVRPQAPDAVRVAGGTDVADAAATLVRCADDARHDVGSARFMTFGGRTGRGTNDRLQCMAHGLKGYGYKFRSK